MKFCLQDPNLTSYNLHEELLLSSIGATKGVGVFAFVTKSGVNLLLLDDFFIDFISNNTFVLIVGTDEITDINALNSLKELMCDYPNLTVKAFLNNRKNLTFHPKYCWFKYENSGVAIFGSGNLTHQGLRRNWEAFTVQELALDQITSLEYQWNDWFINNQQFLKDLDNAEIIEKVKQNIRKRKKETNSQLDEENEKDDTELTSDEQTSLIEEKEALEAWSFDAYTEILIAEVPKSGNRWNQVNFDKESFSEYFGAIPGDNRLRIIFRGIDESGFLGEAEVRQSVSVRSQNYRFELLLAKGKEYPSSGRPIGIFFKVTERNFLYMLKMPEDNYYSEFTQLLNDKQQSSTHLRRIRFSIEEVINKIPELPIWRYFVDDRD